MTQSATGSSSNAYKYGLTIDKPAVYCIRVVGYLDTHWSDRLGGLKITSSRQRGGKVITTLSGQVIDQAALFGVLNALYEMRLPLLFVEYCVDSPNHTLSKNCKEC